MRTPTGRRGSKPGTSDRRLRRYIGGMDTPEAALANDIAELHRLVTGSRSVVAFTGAGISTESGVPDFRSPDSPWMRNRPIPFEAFLRSEEARREAWRRKFAMDDLYRGAQPNRAHRALAAFVHSGKMPAVITQNIDGLHQESGIEPERVIEIHGNG